MILNLILHLLHIGLYTKSITKKLSIYLISEGEVNIVVALISLTGAEYQVNPVSDLFGHGFRFEELTMHTDEVVFVAGPGGQLHFVHWH